MANPGDSRLLRQQIDSEICPPGRMLDWQSSVVSTPELTLINHTHGLISGFVQGPENVRIAKGLRALRDLEGLRGSVRAAIDGHDSPGFGLVVSTREEELAQGLRTVTSSLRFAEREDEIVPKILEQFSADFSYPDGVIEDLNALGTAREAHNLAVREGLMTNLDLELFMTLEGILLAKRFGHSSPLSRVEVEGSSRAVMGRLSGLHRDVEGNTFLEIRRDSGGRRQQVRHDTASQIDIGGVTEPMPQTVKA